MLAIETWMCRFSSTTRSSRTIHLVRSVGLLRVTGMTVATCIGQSTGGVIRAHHGLNTVRSRGLAIARPKACGHEARVADFLGDRAAAAALLQRVLDDKDLAPRNRVYYQATLAENRLADGDIAAALEVGRQTLGDLALVGSVRTLKTLQPLTQHDPAFRDHYRVVADGLSTKVASLP